jgi:hypothetical protein
VGSDGEERGAAEVEAVEEAVEKAVEVVEVVEEVEEELDLTVEEGCEADVVALAATTAVRCFLAAGALAVAAWVRRED